jgi:hypothetical protein
MAIIVGTTADPTPLMIASRTGHMIAATILFCSGFAFWTILDIALVIFCPLIKADIILSPAAAIMIGITAGKADFKPALASNHAIGPFLNIECAIGLGAPPEVGVQVHIDVIFELEVLFIDGFRAKVPDVFPRVLHGAGIVRALDAPHLAIGNVVLQIVNDAV